MILSNISNLIIESSEFGNNLKHEIKKHKGKIALAGGVGAVGLGINAHNAYGAKHGTSIPIEATKPIVSLKLPDQHLDVETKNAIGEGYIRKLARDMQDKQLSQPEMKAPLANPPGIPGFNHYTNDLNYVVQPDDGSLLMKAHNLIHGMQLPKDHTNAAIDGIGKHISNHLALHNQ